MESKFVSIEDIRHTLESVLDGIPKGLPALARAQKVLGKMRREKTDLLPKPHHRTDPVTEEAIGEELVHAILHALDAGIDLEGALHRSVKRYETAFREREKNKSACFVNFFVFISGFDIQKNLVNYGLT